MMWITPRTASAMLAATFVFGASSLAAQTSKTWPPDSASSSGSLTDDLHTQAQMSRTDGAKAPASARPVSADVLRHPVKDKVRRMLQRALEMMGAGNHEAAIGQLKETLGKYPDSAPYAHSLLGVEYVKTQHFEDAVNSFEVAAAFLPHDAMTHYNFGLSLACAGDYTRAETETRRALELDPNIEDARALMHVLEERRATGN